MATHIGRVDIQRWIQKVAESKLSVPEYFDNRRVPFSRAQYYRYRKKMDQEGVESLKDKRTQGNSRRLTAEAEGYLKGYVSGKPECSLAEVRAVLKERFLIDLSEPGVSRCLKRLGCSRKDKPRQEKVERTYTVCGGFELITALA